MKITLKKIRQNPFKHNNICRMKDTKDRQEIRNGKEYLIREKPLKALLLFALPMIIGNLFQQFYTMVDSVVVGRFVSENALAAVGLLIP